MARYGMSTSLKGDFDEVKTRVAGALKAEGFGILSEIDVQATLKEKLGAELERYEILGGCNPQLAQQALDADRSVGLLLPCNVVVRERNGGTEVYILDPEAMFEVADDATRRLLAPVAHEAKQRLERALTALNGGTR